MISAVIPTFRRPQQLLGTLARIMGCTPQPEEILIHIDAGDTETEAAVRGAFPAVRILSSGTRMGPGGGRNKLLEAARGEIVVSFDDDSYPLDSDYFSRVAKIFSSLGDASVVGSSITEKAGKLEDAVADAAPAIHFGGGGVAYRRDAFLASGGYVPLVIAYGMEEVDLCIRMMDAGAKIYSTRWLRVFHDNDHSHHASPQVTAGSVSNLALLVYLRYPYSYWPYGAAQLLNRLVWLVRVGRVKGLAFGLLRIPGQVWVHRSLRKPVRVSTLERYIRERRNAPAYAPLEV